jgi:membrane-bound lytic murein transglycosylase D
MPAARPPVPTPEPEIPVAEAAPAKPSAADPVAPAPRNSATPVVPVTHNDSLALAKQARDSALDASVLEALAEASPSENLSTEDADAASWRALFDIDVANWMDHHRVRYYLDFFSGPVRERMGIWLERMPRYEPTIRAKLIAKGLPGDLAYLPLIESGYSATAVSRSKAVGMWQFMRGTAQLYGLRVDGWVDERRDVPKATEAAIRFLADLTAKFGSPYLAAAAYNGGPGRIQRGLARIEGYETSASDELDGEDPTGPQAGDAAFFQLADTRHIMRETKDYVPKLIAAAMIAKQPERYGFPAIENVPVDGLDSVVVKDATGLDVIAKAAGVTLTDLWAANPMYLRAVTPPKRTAVVRVPAGRGAEAQEVLDGLPASARLTALVHHVKRGETSAMIAKRYGLTVAELRAVNVDLKSRAPRPGEALEIPGRVRLAGWVTESRRVVSDLDGPGTGPTHRVSRGETLSHISRRYGVSVTSLRAWNHLGAGSVIRVGQLLRVKPPVPAARPPIAGTKSRRTTSPSSGPS